MYVVYKVVLQGQDGNRGVEYERKKEFLTLEDAEEYMGQQETNGWIRYTIVIE